MSWLFAGLQAGVQQDVQQHCQHAGERGTPQFSPVRHFSLQERTRGRQEEPEDRQSSAGAGTYQVGLRRGLVVEMEKNLKYFQELREIN